MKILDWNSLDEDGRRRALERPSRAIEPEIRDGVSRILEEVAARGDEAVRALARRYDGLAPDALEVSAEAWDAAARDVPPELREAVRAAGERIRAFHAAGAPEAVRLETAPGVRCERILRPIARVGLYVPAGSAPLLSTVLMLAIPARLAGCREIVLCTPPRPDGRADGAILYAARVSGVSRVFTIGGAQAVAAMALGTESVPRCDKLFGPGNAWVTEAKRQVSARPDGPAIDVPAGPSEVLVIADASADPELVAADLLAQAEHGPDSQALLVSPEAALLEVVRERVYAQCAEIPRSTVAVRALAASRALRVRDLAQALEISNAYAPEHLILAVERPRALLDNVGCAGSVFLGSWSPESVGDYASGTNHVLPTAGHARAWSGVSVASFLKAITVQELDPEGLRAIGPGTVTLARAEGLEAHARAVTRRLARLDAS